MTGSAHSERPASWVVVICGVLFLATFLNYACRVTVTQNSVEIIRAYDTDRAGYGWAEGWFGWGFAAGGLVFGVLADLISIRWLYPAVVVAWSAAGAASGRVETLEEFAACRFLVGLFEAGHWPCALRMTQRTFLPHQRTWGNGILQSGASIGQVLTPQLVVLLAHWDTSGWRMSFWVTGLAGIPWAVIWLLTVRDEDVRRPVIQTDEQASGVGSRQEIEERPLVQIFLSRRWWLLLLTVVAINVPWHYIRVWMPDTLEHDLHYSKEFVANFTSIYYVSTFFGSLSVGWVISWLVRFGWNVHRARLAAFFGYSLLVACTVPAAHYGGQTLLGLLLVIAFGSLGVSPIYYSLNQELSGRHQGKVGGSLSFLLWMALGFMHRGIGALVEARPDSRPYVLAAVGVLPLIAWAALVLFWGVRRSPSGASGAI